MLQIKTILNRLDYSISFDKEVNAALRDGWTLKKRTVLQPIGQSESVYAPMMLYAELEKEFANWINLAGYAACGGELEAAHE